ncbi:MAG: rhodanese-like domain-containing protein [Sphingobacteriaceae bacterium]|nr:rhodanese-like domain-containing protein [Sphingobacteriaceae bacterium]
MLQKQIITTEICPSIAQTLLKNDAIFVDVRELTEVELLSFKVPQLIILPLSELENRYFELPQDQLLVIVCNNGSRSLKATNFLINKGYNAGQVVCMKHGLIKWVQKGFPTVGDASFIPGKKNFSCKAKIDRELATL